MSKHIGWLFVLTALAATVADVPQSRAVNGDPKDRPRKPEMTCYVRRAGQTFATECKFRITRLPSGWTIKSWTNRGTVHMEVETRYDGHEQPTSAHVVLTRDGRVQTAKVLVKDGKATILRDGKPAETFDVPKGTIVTSAPDWTDVFLVCRQYDRKRKGTQEFPALWVHPAEAPQRLTFSIEWQGADTIEHHGKKTALSRYGLVIRNRSRYVAWADAEGRMIRLLPLPLKGTPSGLTLESYEKSAAGLRPLQR